MNSKINTQSDSQNKPLNSQATNPNSLAPWAMMWGLGLLAAVLALIGHGLRWLMGYPMSQVLWQAVQTLAIFVLGIPLACCVVAVLMNRFVQAGIHLRNAWTLGWLLSVVAMVSMMGKYS